LWINPNRQGLQPVKRIAVLAGAWGASKEVGLIPLLQALEDAFRSAEIVEVCPYRDVLLRLQDPHVDLPPPMPAGGGWKTARDLVWGGCVAGMCQRGPVVLEYAWRERIDPVLAESLGQRLQVEAVCIAWLPQCGAETGDMLLVQIFSTSGGRSLGGWAGSRQGWESSGGLAGAMVDQHSYNQATSFRLLSAEAVSTLKETLIVR
jgi:hypothetical protein